MKAVLKQAARATVHRLLRPAEARLLARHPATRHPPCFIVGAPRSGTSLFYELLVTRYRLAFFSNLAHRFWRTPAAVTRLGWPLIAPRCPSFTSDHGHIEGWGAPNEAGWIWRRWLADGDWSDERTAPGLPGAEMRGTLGAMEAVMGAPFVNKNVMHSNRMRLLDALFPGCIFIEVRRNSAATARSIIRAERNNKGPARHPDDWWSVRPSNVAPGDVVERAALQVRGVAADIARDGAFLGNDRLLSIDYDDLCAAPEICLDGVGAFLKGHGLPLVQHMPVPRAFNLPSAPLLDPPDERRMQALLMTPVS